MNKLKIFIGNSTFTKELVLDNWFFIYIRLYLRFAVHKLAKFSSNSGKVHFEGFVNLLRYIMENKTLVLEYYADIKDAPLYELFRQADIKT